MTKAEEFRKNAASVAEGSETLANEIYEHMLGICEEQSKVGKSGCLFAAGRNLPAAFVGITASLVISRLETDGFKITTHESRYGNPYDRVYINW